MGAAAILLAAGVVTFAGTQPQLAGHGHEVYVAFGSGDTVEVARSTDAGATFAAPTALPAAGRLALGMHRGPRVAVTAEAVVVAAIAGAKGGGADGDVLVYRSTDHGRTWSAPVVVNDVPGAAREGLHALGANASGVVVLAWLDLREKGTRIFAAVSRDHGRTWSPDRLVYASPGGAICECCHPSVAVAADGRIAVLFRNHLGGDRDMYVVEAPSGADAFSAARKQGTGSWPLDACPMDGGGLSIAGASTVSVWRRAETVYTAADGGAEVAIGTGRDPAIARASDRPEDRIDLAWTDGAGVQLRQGEGTPRAVGAGRFPSVLAFATHTLVASEDQGRVTIQTVGR